jgi:hypothetical protein
MTAEFYVLLLHRPHKALQDFSCSGEGIEQIRYRGAMPIDMRSEQSGSAECNWLLTLSPLITWSPISSALHQVLTLSAQRYVFLAVSSSHLATTG